MDTQTHSYYQENAIHLAERYDLAKTSKFRSFTKNLPLKGSLLDIGCGSGRDAAWLQTQGYTVTAMDSSLNILKQAGKYHPELKPRLIHACLPFSNDTFPIDKFNIISVIAVLMHIPDYDLNECIYQFKKLLQPNGHILISVSVGREGLLTINGKKRDPQGRLFIERSPDKYQALFEQAGFTLVAADKNRDGLGRGTIEWYLQIYKV